MWFVDEDTLIRIDEFCREDDTANTDAQVSPSELLWINRLIEESY